MSHPLCRAIHTYKLRYGLGGLQPPYGHRSATIPSFSSSDQMARAWGLDASQTRLGDTSVIPPYTDPNTHSQQTPWPPIHGYMPPAVPGGSEVVSPHILMQQSRSYDPSMSTTTINQAAEVGYPNTGMTMQTQGSTETPVHFPTYSSPMSEGSFRAPPQPHLPGGTPVTSTSLQGGPTQSRPSNPYDEFEAPSSKDARAKMKYITEHEWRSVSGTTYTYPEIVDGEIPPRRMLTRIPQAHGADAQGADTVTIPVTLQRAGGRPGQGGPSLTYKRSDSEGSLIWTCDRQELRGCLAQGSRVCITRDLYRNLWSR